MTPEVQQLLAVPTPWHRRWLRFSMRNFLVFTTLVGCIFGWAAKERRQSYKERLIGDELQSLGLRVDFAGPFDSWDLRQSGQPQGWWRDVARRVLGQRVEVLSASDSFDSREFPQLAGLTSVKKLGLYHLVGIDPLSLSGFEDLKELCLADCRVSDQQIDMLHEALTECSIVRMRSNSPRE